MAPTNPLAVPIQVTDPGRRSRSVNLVPTDTLAPQTRDSLRCQRHGKRRMSLGADRENMGRGGMEPRNVLVWFIGGNDIELIPSSHAKSPISSMRD